MFWAENKLSPEKRERINELNPENQLTQSGPARLGPIPYASFARGIYQDQHSSSTLRMLKWLVEIGTDSDMHEE